MIQLIHKNRTFCFVKYLYKKLLFCEERPPSVRVAYIEVNKTAQWDHDIGYADYHCQSAQSAQSFGSAIHGGGIRATYKW